MTYEKAGSKQLKDGKRILLNDLDRLTTPAIVWHLVKRHKFALVTIYALGLTVVYLMPFAPDALLSIFGH